jgi:type IX secretion system PorP/SprF family membrane protein
MKKRITVAALALIATNGFAQQDPQLSMNMFNRMAVNAGYAGTTGSICATAIGRNQWMGFEGNPSTFVLNLDAPINALKGGLGLSIMSDQIGVEKSVQAKLAYSYHYKLADGILGGGLDIGIINKTLGGGLNPLQTGDQSIPSSELSATAFDVGIGAYYTSQKFYAGISANHLPQSTFDMGSVQYKSRMHLYFMGGYNLQLANPDLMVVPSIFVKNAASTQLDLNCNVHYKSRYFGGLSYRMQDAVVVMLGGNVWKDLKLGLAYDVNTSKLNPYNNGTLEFMLNYCFKIKIEKPRQVYRNVRYL